MTAIPSEIREYLISTRQAFEQILGGNLVGLYLCGSLVQSDFRADRSDIDLLGVVANELDETSRIELSARLAHDTSAVPARGLETVLFTEHTAQHPVSELPYEFAISTGPEWQTEIQQRGTAGDMLIDIVLCLQVGRTLFGASPDKVFRPVPLDLLHKALIEELHWHRQEVQKRSSDTSFTNAILNAARSLHAAETGQILSKTQGGLWWLQRNPSDRLVVEALDCRDSGQPPAIGPNAALVFVENVISRIENLRD